MKTWDTFWTRRVTPTDECADVSAKVIGGAAHHIEAQAHYAFGPSRREGLELESVLPKIGGVLHPRKFPLWILMGRQAKVLGLDPQTRSNVESPAERNN